MSSVKPTTSAQPAEPAKGEDHPGFLKEHFGNPEGDEVYGTANDYETEAEQIKDEKRSANQAIWYLGALAVFLLLGYLFLG